MACGRKIGPFDCCSVVQGDSIDLLANLPPESIDVVITDPPYSSGTRQATNRTASNIPKRGERWSRAGIIWDTSFSTFGLGCLMNTVLRSCKDAMRDGAHIYLFIDWRQYPLLTLNVESAGLFINNLLVWDKGMYALGGNWRSQHELIVFASRGPARELTAHDTGNVITCKRVSGGDHPTEKPVELLSHILEYSAESDSIVLDPFAGSGSTLVAAKQAGRHYLGFEISPEYCAIARKRLDEIDAQPVLFQPKPEQLSL